jgi:peroxiredoxin
MISPQTREHSRGFKEEKNLPMTLLSDPGNCVGETYGLVYTFPEDLKKTYLKLDIDLEKYNGNKRWRLPIPARYIIDTDGIVRYARASADHTIRPEPQETIEALKKLA